MKYINKIVTHQGSNMFAKAIANSNNPVIDNMIVSQKNTQVMIILQIYNYQIYQIIYNFQLGELHKIIIHLLQRL